MGRFAFIAISPSAVTEGHSFPTTEAMGWGATEGKEVARLQERSTAPIRIIGSQGREVILSRRLRQPEPFKGSLEGLAELQTKVSLAGGMRSLFASELQ